MMTGRRKVRRKSKMTVMKKSLCLLGEMPSLLTLLRGIGIITPMTPLSPIPHQSTHQGGRNWSSTRRSKTTALHSGMCNSPFSIAMLGSNIQNRLLT